MKDIETQIIFINAEIQKHTEAIDSLQSIKNTITGLTSPTVASLQPLVEENNELKNQVSEKDNLIISLRDEIKNISPADKITP